MGRFKKKETLKKEKKVRYRLKVRNIGDSRPFIFDYVARDDAKKFIVDINECKLKWVEFDTTHIKNESISAYELSVIEK